MSGSTSQRRQSRELALQVLFQLEFAPQQELGAALNNFRDAYSAPEDVWAYALTLLNGVQNQKAHFDKIIGRNTSHWKIERLALVDLNILRVATFELSQLQTDVPPAVAINEAIEIARKYGTTDSAKFVNGVLDQIKRDLTENPS